MPDADVLKDCNSLPTNGAPHLNNGVGIPASPLNVYHLDRNRHRNRDAESTS